ncbi:MAG: site-specific recombinase, partial [Actinomycetota bacterium]|nr:site-specific recombinase [Actinomycetota bacterium]
PGWVHVETYTDQISGAKADRPDLSRAMRDARLGRFDVLLVYRVDRFARSLKVLVGLLEELESYGVAFRSATEPIDTSTATGRMLVQLLGVFAEFERATIIDRVVNGMERKAARGGWPGGTIPHGLAVDEDGRLTIVPEDFPLVARVFTRYDTGTVGAASVAAELNGDGLRSRNGRPWTPQVILLMLRNRCYLGEVNWRGQWYRSADAPFIDPVQFDRVQALLDQRGEGYEKRFATRRPEYLLTSLVKCDRCQRNFVGTSAHGKRHRYRYYMCWTRQRYGPQACNAERVRADELETAVFDALVAIYSDPKLIRDATLAQQTDLKADGQRRADALSAMDAELRKADAAVNRYMTAFEDGKLAADMFDDRVRELLAKAELIRSRRAELHAEGPPNERWVPTNVAVRTVRDDLRDAAKQAPDPIRKAVAQAFVHELRVQAGNVVLPTFRVLPRLPDHTPCGTDHAHGPTGTGVRVMTSRVGAEGFEPPTPSL